MMCAGYARVGCVTQDDMRLWLATPWAIVRMTEAESAAHPMAKRVGNLCYVDRGLHPGGVIDGPTGAEIILPTKRTRGLWLPAKVPGVDPWRSVT